MILLPYNLIIIMNPVKTDLNKMKNKSKAKLVSRFFKTGKGEYGEGDIFLGITVPAQRNVAKRHLNASFENIKELLDSEAHEHRLTALLILVGKYNGSDPAQKKKIVDFYLENIARVNSWDLVDLSADKILGDYIYGKDKKILHDLAKSKNMWERRISIVSTFAFIRRNDFKSTLEIAETFLRDEQDLIHKSSGWMLREIGKRNQEIEEKFLLKHYKQMPRTMLRYAIERFSKNKRKFYMGSVNS